MRACRGWRPRLLATILVLTAWPTVLAAIRGQSTLLAAGLLGLSVGLARYQSGLALGLSLLKPTRRSALGRVAAARRALARGGNRCR